MLRHLKANTSSVYFEHPSCHEPRVFTQEEAHHPRNVALLRKSAQWHPLLQLCHLLLRPCCLEHWSVDPARVDSVNSDPQWAELRRRRQRQSTQREFRARVQNEAWRAPKTGDGRCQDDATSVAQVFHGLACVLDSQES